MTMLARMWVAHWSIGPSTRTHTKVQPAALHCSQSIATCARLRLRQSTVYSWSCMMRLCAIACHKLAHGAWPWRKMVDARTKAHAQRRLLLMLLLMGCVMCMQHGHGPHGTVICHMALCGVLEAGVQGTIPIHPQTPNHQNPKCTLFIVHSPLFYRLISRWWSCLCMLCLNGKFSCMFEVELPLADCHKRPS